MNDAGPDRDDEALLAELLADDGFALPQAAPGVAPRAPAAAVPATPAQERLWTVERIDGVTGAFNLGLDIRFDGPLAAQLNVPALQRALDALMARHEALRVRFVQADADADAALEQRIAPATALELPLQVRALACAEWDAAMQAALAQPFDLGAGKLVRAQLLRGGSGQDALLLTFHHAIVDRWSASILVRELASLYAGCVQGGDGAPALVQPALQFGDYAVWLRAQQQTGGHAREEAYWRQRLDGMAPALALPFSTPSPQASHRCEWIDLALAPSLGDAACRFAASLQATPFMVMLAAWSAVLARFSGMDDIAIGVPVANRPAAEAQDMVGFFVETMVARTTLDTTLGFRHLLEQVRADTLADFRHQNLPFDEVVRVAAPERLAGVAPLFQSMLVFQTMASMQYEAGGLHWRARPLAPHAARADLVLELDAGAGALSGALAFRSGVIDPQVAAAIANAIGVLLEAALADPAMPVAHLPLQRPQQARAMLAARNQPLPPVAPVAPVTLSAWFLERVARAPAAVALIDGERSVSYAELERDSATLAAHLAGLGAGPGVAVAICLPRSTALAIAILGTIRAGAAFVPMDPAFPASRLAYMLADSGAPILVASGVPDWLPEQGTPTLLAPVLLDPVLVDAGQLPAPDDPNRPDSLLYILYTSGSSGPAKAVMGLHQGALNRLRWMMAYAPFGPDELCCQKTAPTFVDFVCEFFGPLLGGVPALILAPAQVQDPALLADALERHRVTRLVLVPSLLKAMLDHVVDPGRRLRALRLCICSGEALSAELARRFLALVPACRLLNLYGASEVSADSTFHEVGPADGQWVPIGRPIPGNLVALLDSGGNAVPLGAAGEIVIGGIGVAQGYWRQPGLSAQRFVTPPEGMAGSRAFRSGDLGRWRPDGAIDYLGRLDRQVKIRGVRIEPAEVRAALMDFPGIADAAVTAPLLDGEATLVAHVVAHAIAAGDLAGVPEAALRQHAAQVLPLVMQPTRYVWLPRLPLNANGKLDVAALPAPAAAPDAPQDVPAASLSSDEASLASLWEQVTGQRPVSAQAHFFRSGGHSLGAVRLAAAIAARFAVQLPVATMFAAPTLAAMAREVRRAQGGAGLPPLVAGAAGRRGRASFNQQRLWLIEQDPALRGLYNEAVVYRLRGALDADRLEQALRQVIRRHEALRTCLVERDGVLWQEVAADPHWALAQVALDGAGDAAAQCDAVQRSAAALPFALERDLPLRATLVRLGSEEHVLILVLHHSATDGWSGRIIVDDLRQAYAGASLALRPAPLQPIDVAAWQHGCQEQGRFAPALAYWCTCLAEVPAQLALGSNAVPLQRHWRRASVALMLDQAAGAQLRRVAHAEQLSPFVILLAVWGLALARCGAEDEVVVGIPVANRSDPAQEGIVGFLASTIPVRIACGGASFAAFAGRVRQRVAEGLQHQHVGFDQIVHAAAIKRIPGRQALVQATFALSDSRDGELHLDGIAAQWQASEPVLARADLGLILREDGDGIGGELAYAADLIAPALASHLAASFLFLLDAVLAQPAMAPLAHPLTPMPAAPPGAIVTPPVPAPAVPSVPAAGGQAGRDDLAVIAALWRALLEVDEVGLDDHFFDVGGHSMLLLRLRALLAQHFGEAPSIADLFRFPTIRSLAAHLAHLAHDTAAPPPAPVLAAAAPGPIAIIGMACRFPGAPDLDAFWDLLASGREGIGRFDAGTLAAAGRSAAAQSRPGFVAAGAMIAGADCFDAAFFGLGPRDAVTLDPQHRVALECAWHALEHAGYTPSAPNDAIGIFLGVGANTYLQGQLQGHAAEEGADAYHAMSGNDKDFAATRIAYHLDLKGPALAVQTACSSSLVALDLACQALHGGSARMALAGGVAIRFPQGAGYLHEPGMILSPDGHCKPFSADAQGTVPGSGVGMVLLKPLARALEDGDNVLAVIKASAVNNDGARKVGFAAPGVDGQVAVIASALQKAGLTPDAIDYVEAHGTGTELGDPVEVAALTQVFGGRTRVLALGSVKSNIGHADAAAGIAGVIKTALALQHGVIPPSLHFSAPNPYIDFGAASIEIPVSARPWPARDDGSPRRAGVSAFGIGGTNAHAVLEQAPPLHRQGAHPARCVLLLSARSQRALQAALVKLAEALESQPGLDLADVAFTLQHGRVGMAQRHALVADTRAAAIDALRRQAAGMADGSVKSVSAPAAGVRVAFLFPGQGSQFPGMAAAWYAGDAPYRDCFDRCALGLLPHLGLDLRTLLYGTADQAVDAAQLRQTALAQPALFCVMYALAQSLEARGITADAMLGHSLGEYVAACLAGVFSLDDALALVATRGRLMQGMPAGAMLAVQAGRDAVAGCLGNTAGGMPDVAASNGPTQCVLTGPEAAIAAAQARLHAAGMAALRLDTSHAFHSASMDAALPAFHAALAQLRLSAPRRRFISNLSGTWITAAEAVDPGYWARHLRGTVEFGAGLDCLRQDGIGLLLELGAGNALQNLARSAGWQPALLPSLGLRHAPSLDAPDAHSLVAQCWTAGAAIDWSVRGPQPGGPAGPRRLALPGYVFAPQRHWPQPAPDPAPDRAVATPAGRAPLADWFYLPGWQRAPQRRPDPAAGAGRWLLFGVDTDSGAALAAALRAWGHEVVVVQAGAAFSAHAERRYVIDPRAAADYRRLVSAETPTRIVHLWAGQEPALASVLLLAQALGADAIARAVDLAIVVRGGADVCGDETLDAALGPLLGAASILPVEYPGLRCRLIDTDGANTPLLLEELLDSEDQLAQVALRGRQRWVPQLLPLRLDAPAPARSRLREAGCYLITGAFGGMGSAIASDLARSWRARLVLLGRHVDAALVATLEELGAQVLAVACDVSDAGALAGAVDAARARFGAIDGAIHCAGVADLGGVLQNRDIASIEAAMAAKVQGCLALDALLADEARDFFVLCSSLGNFLPHAKFGQIGYAAANAFLDLFALTRNAGGRFTVAINWDDWCEAGMTVAASRRLGRAAPGLHEAMSAQEGVEVLHRILAAPHARVAVSVRNLPLLIAGSAALLDRTAPPLPESAAATPTLAGLSPTEAQLAAAWQQVLGVASVAPDDNFFRLGGHSLIAMRLLTFVRENFKVELGIAAVFEHPTLAQLAALIDRLQPQGVSREEFTL